MARILLVEDDISNQILVKACLNPHEIIISGTLESAKKNLLQTQFDLIILDVHLPDGDGFSFLVEISSLPQRQGIPIVMLTSRNESADKVTGYSMGADDYMTKPIDPLVFKAAIESKIRKRMKEKNSEAIFQRDGFDLDIEKQKVLFNSGHSTRTIDLTTLEFKIFLYMLKNKERIFSREELIQTIWGSDLNVSDRSVDSQMSNLRKRLLETTVKIQSVYGAGYKLTSASSKD